MLNFNDGYLKPIEVVILIVISIAMVTSILLNPLVFRYNRLRPTRSIANILFQALGVVDVLTCILLPAHILLVAGQSVPDPASYPSNFSCIDSNYWNCVRLHVSPHEKVMSVGVLGLIVSSLVVTSIMAICRWYQVRYPFRQLHKKTVIGVLLFANLASLSLQVYSIFGSVHPPVWVVQVMTVWTDNPFRYPDSMRKHFRLLQMITVFSIPVFFQMLGLAASFGTVVVLIKPPKQIKKGQHRMKSTTQRGSVKILVTNLGSIVFVVMQIIGLIVQSNARKIQIGDDIVTVNTEWEGWFNFCACSMTSILFSGTNPVIFILFTPDVIRKSLGWPVARSTKSDHTWDTSQFARK